MVSWVGRTTPTLHPPPCLMAFGSPGAQAAGGRTQRRRPQSLTFAFGRGEGSRGAGERQAGRPARLLSTAWATCGPSLHPVQPAAGGDSGPQCTAGLEHPGRSVPPEESSVLPHEGCALSAHLCICPPPGADTRHTDGEPRAESELPASPGLFWV